MSSLSRFALVGLAILMVLALVFRSEIARFLFHPEGLSLAAGEMCFINGTVVDLVVRISVDNGATTTTFVVPDEKACSAASSAQSDGVIQVSLAEAEPPFCQTKASAGQTLTLSLFDPPLSCDWKG